MSYKEIDPLQMMSHKDLVAEVKRLNKIIDRMGGNTTTIEQILTDNRGNQSETARMINTTRTTLRTYIDDKTINRVAILDNGEMQVLVPPRLKKSKR